MALLPRLRNMYQRAKNILHAVQALLIFVAAMITIAIFTQGGQSDGRITYFFALCFICLPFLVYQTAVPTFRRSKRFANAYAHAVIDLLLSILWFAASIGEVVWAKDGTQAGKDFKDGDGICQVFGYGSTTKCHLGQVTMWFGVVIFLLSVIASTFSIYAVLYYRKNGTLPGNDDATKDPENFKSDNLEFNGTSPDIIYNGSNSNPQQEMRQHQPLPPAEDHHYDEPPRSATLPPRPLYPKAPRTPLPQDFEPVVDPSHFDHDADVEIGDSSYPGFHHDDDDSGVGGVGDYGALPSQRPQPQPQVSVGNAGGRHGYGIGGNLNLAFPVGDYGR